MTFRLFCFLLLLGPSLAFAQPSKTALAVRVDGDTIRVDGRLDEAVWRDAVPLSDFVQKEPNEGALPTDGMEVRFAYDADALYIGARMFTRESRAVQSPLGRRDDASQAEHILISLDTFLDRRTAAAFGVTATGVRIDRFHSSDNEDSFDSGFDPVWEARTAREEESWTAELWIPFSQLRFSPLREHVWGLNVQRFRPTLNEVDYWVVIPRTERAWSSRFGELRGIANVRPSRRVEVLPYVAASSTLNGDRDRGNPFDNGRNLASRTGGDVKMGLGPNLTVEATFNPDFGQIEADPAEVNLSAFETRFPEKRPFFLEGSSLFNIGHPNFYYSRRIGARPIGPAAADYVDYPSASTIIGAAKLTGRLPSKTSIGVLTAVTAEESARLADLDNLTIRTATVAPRSYHTVGRVLQEFGENASTAGAYVNVVHRDVAAGEPLANLLTRNAIGIAGNTTLRFKRGEYEFRAQGGTSYIDGERAAIERVQRSSAHYAQRPDRGYSVLDPTLTSLHGWTMQAAFDRLSGRHWLWGLSTKIDSENFETNDFANLNGADGLLMNGNVRYRETRPGKIFRAYTIGLNVSNDSTIRLLRQTGDVRPNVSVTWTNFWTTSFDVRRILPQQNVTQTRGGPIMARSGGWGSSLNFGSPSTSQTRITGNLTLTELEDGGSTHRASTSVSFRPAPRWQFSVNPFYERLTDAAQYVTTLPGGRAETYNSRYVFSSIDRSTLSMALRLGLTLKPDMNLDVYMEPFAASGRYYDHGELLTAGGEEQLTYGHAGTILQINPDGSREVRIGDASFSLRNRDFNTLSFRSNIVLRWEWRPGSTLYAVWQQDRAATEAIGTRVSVGDMFQSLTATGSHVFVVKTSFWLPVR